MYLIQKFILPFDAWLIILPAFFTGVGWLISKWVDRKKHRAETEGIVVRQFSLLAEAQNKRIDALQKSNDKCELEHEKTKLEMEEMKKAIGFQPKLKGRVFILDDDFDVLHDFKKEFKRLSVLDYRGYHNYDEFLQAAKIEKPEMVVLDHRLDGGRTAEDVISNLGYMPEIIIMSGEVGYSKKYDVNKIKFYLKEGNYVLAIAAEVISYLSSKQ
jgi:hypothetical protein